MPKSDLGCCLPDSLGAALFSQSSFLAFPVMLWSTKSPFKTFIFCRNEPVTFCCIYPRTPDNILLGNLLAAFYKPKHNIPQIQMVLTNSIRKDAYSRRKEGKGHKQLAKEKIPMGHKHGKRHCPYISKMQSFQTLLRHSSYIILIKIKSANAQCGELVGNKRGIKWLNLSGGNLILCIKI